MKPTGNINVNTPYYWGNIYEDAEKRSYYEVQSNIAEYDIVLEDGTPIRPSSRMRYMCNEVVGDKVMDLGSGVGTLTRMIKDAYPDKEVWGVDIAKSAVDYTSKRDDDISYKRCSVEEVPYSISTVFDTVLSGEVLEHLDDPNELFKTAYSILNKGGRFVVSCPNWDAVVSPEHVWYFKEADVEKMFLDNGFDKPRFIKLPKKEDLIIIMGVGEKL